jgi:hypothetical protein
MSRTIDEERCQSSWGIVHTFADGNLSQPLGLGAMAGECSGR